MNSEIDLSAAFKAGYSESAEIELQAFYMENIPGGSTLSKQGDHDFIDVMLSRTNHHTGEIDAIVELENLTDKQAEKAAELLEQLSGELCQWQEAC